MSFSSWCEVRASDARRHADAAYQRVLHQRFRRDAAARYARLYLEYERLMDWKTIL